MRRLPRPTWRQAWQATAVLFAYFGAVLFIDYLDGGLENAPLDFVQRSSVPSDIPLDEIEARLVSLLNNAPGGEHKVFAIEGCTASWTVDHGRESCNRDRSWWKRVDSVDLRILRTSRWAVSTDPRSNLPKTGRDPEHEATFALTTSIRWRFLEEAEKRLRTAGREA